MAITGRTRSGPALWLALAALSAGCAGSIRRELQPAVTVDARHFLEFPTRFRGREVRLEALTVARADPQRPLVFTHPGADDQVLVVNDARGLARKSPILAAVPVTIRFRCMEGRTDRGNLLLAVDASPSPGS